MNASSYKCFFFTNNKLLFPSVRHFWSLETFPQFDWRELRKVNECEIQKHHYKGIYQINFFIEIFVFKDILNWYKGIRHVLVCCILFGLHLGEISSHLLQCWVIYELIELIDVSFEETKIVLACSFTHPVRQVQ